MNEENEKPSPFNGAVKPDDLTDYQWTDIIRHGCCPKARIQQCVCFVKFDCPDHGAKCNGSHD